jgi:hypothetical protein
VLKIAKEQIYGRQRKLKSSGKTFFQSYVSYRNVETRKIIVIVVKQQNFVSYSNSNTILSEVCQNQFPTWGTREISKATPNINSNFKLIQNLLITFKGYEKIVFFC